jgi:galactokinase
VDGRVAREERGHWSNYVRGVVAVLLAEGHRGPGLDLTISGDVPRGAGLSSSAALEVAVAGALRVAWQIGIDDRSLAELARRAESDFVGVHCGIMDQYAAALSREGHALLIDCRTQEAEHIPLTLDEHDLVVVVVHSGVARSLDSSAYNQRRIECYEALRRLRDAMAPHRPASLRDVRPSDLEAHKTALPELLQRRARHVVTEIDRVASAIRALRAGKTEAFGSLMYDSHASLRDDFEVSCDELDLLVQLAQETPGVLGSRLTGAGFGGCTLSLVRRAALEDFETAVVRRYAKETGMSPSMMRCAPSDGLSVEVMTR